MFLESQINHPMQSGSIEVICAKKNSKYKSKNKKINKILKKEKLITQRDYDTFNLRVETSKKNLLLYPNKVIA